jgi:hypothetical protein
MHVLFPEVGLGLTLWQGEFENVGGTWLRWCYASGETHTLATNCSFCTKDAQLSQKDAQLLEEQARTKQAFIQAIELGLRLKFPMKDCCCLRRLREDVLQAIVFCKRRIG